MVLLDLKMTVVTKEIYLTTDNCDTERVDLRGCGPTRCAPSGALKCQVLRQ